MPIRAASPLARYGLAVLATVLAFLLRLLLWPLLGEASPFLLFTPAVLAAAVYGGLGPGLLATLLGAMLGTFFWIPPAYSLLPADARDVLQIGLFVLVGLIISWLNKALRTAEHRAGRGAAALRASEERFRLLV